MLGGADLNSALLQEQLLQEQEKTQQEPDERQQREELEDADGAEDVPCATCMVCAWCLASKAVRPRQEQGTVRKAIRTCAETMCHKPRQYDGSRRLACWVSVIGFCLEHARAPF